MPTFSAPTGALLAFGHFELPFLIQNSKLKPQTLKLCIQTNIDILFLLALSMIETNEFQVFKIAQEICIFEANLLIVHVFVEILVYDLALKKFEMYKKLCKGVLKL